MSLAQTTTAGIAAPAPRRVLPWTLASALWAPSTWTATLHLLLNFPIGIFWFVVLVTGFSAAAGLVVTLVGLPILLLMGILVRWGGIFERSRVRLLLGLDLQDPYRPLPDGGAWAKIKTRATDLALWRDLLYLLLRFPIGIASFVIAVTAWSVALGLAAAPLAAAFGAPVRVGNLAIDTMPWIVLVTLAGIVLCFVAAWTMRGLAAGERLLAGALLGASPAVLAARVGELSQSRTRSVDAAEAERRRIERDLHDGAQQRLVALAMNLGMALEKMRTEPAAVEALVRQAHDEAKRALVELRDLARGIHPAVLSDRGLDAAISALAARSPVPVRVSVDVAARPSPAIESIAYFVVAEALTNVARHAHATEASVTATRSGDRLAIDVRDDGVGGAVVRPGGGLAGLADRLASVDGTLAVESPPGGPTCVRMEIPCVS